MPDYGTRVYDDHRKTLRTNQLQHSQWCSGVWATGVVVLLSLYINMIDGLLIYNEIIAMIIAIIDCIALRRCRYGPTPLGIKTTLFKVKTYNTVNP